jgi:hypothetical protein
MLETITLDEVDLNGMALAVRYQPDPHQTWLIAQVYNCRLVGEVVIGPIG